MKIKQNYMWYTFSSDEIAVFNLSSNELFILNEEFKNTFEQLELSDGVVDESTTDIIDVLVNNEVLNIA
ncbi:MAG: hypothetical protein GX180_02445 [Enterococcus sp.]|nr:hypothetical protein [Enterococcus sp.]